MSPEELKATGEALRKASALKRAQRAQALRRSQGISDAMDTSSDPKPENAVAGTACEKPAHNPSSKKRGAPCDMSGEYAGPLPDAKREDNTDHADRTVSLDEFWNAKRGNMGIRSEEGGVLLVETPDGVTRVIEPCYEENVTTIPPFPHEYVADFLREVKPNCPKARAWVKAHEASKAARIKAAKKKKEEARKKKEQEQKSQSDQSPGEDLAKKILMERFKNNKRRFNRAVAKVAARRAARQKEEEEKRHSSTIDLSTVRSALDGTQVTDSRADKDIKMTKLSQTPQERPEEAIKTRELHPSILESLDKVHDKLRKTMFGDSPLPKSSNHDFRKYPAGGFPAMEQERNFHANIVRRINKAVGRVCESQQSLLNAMRGDGNASNSDSSSPEPNGPRRTPEGVKVMENKNTRKINPTSAARIQAKHDKLLQAALGDEDPATVDFNKPNFYTGRYY